VGHVRLVARPVRAGLLRLRQPTTGRRLPRAVARDQLPLPSRQSQSSPRDCPVAWKAEAAALFDLAIARFAGFCRPIVRQCEELQAGGALAASHNTTRKVSALLREYSRFRHRIAVIVAGTVVACVLGAAPAAASTRCHGHFPNFLGYTYYRLDVTVYHRNMPCSQAVQLARRAYSLPGLPVIRDPYVFGGGGYGGPFQVGHFGCFLTARGSDFQQSYCSWRRQAVYFYSHRETVPG
jgi:hypothetical protein